MQFIDEQRVSELLSLEELIPAMRQALIDFSGGAIRQPARRFVDVPGSTGFFGAMPAAASGALGAKLVSAYPDNGSKGLAAHHAVIVMFDPSTGVPIVSMDGRLITELRTAAVTAAFLDAAAPETIRSVAVLGAGLQAHAHIDALRLVRRFDDLRIWNRTASRAEHLAAETGGRSMTCEQAVRDADVVIVATASREPVLDGNWLKPGARVASVGWSGQDGAELDAVTMSNVVIVDSREGTAAESGNVRRYAPQIRGELGELFAGRIQVDADETVVFDSIGMACQDVVAAALVCRKLKGCLVDLNGRP
jgi:ornithine cyclodeaminase/alanine dehydrogenase-like protein (mu-crystallin family)